MKRLILLPLLPLLALLSCAPQPAMPKAARDLGLTSDDVFVTFADELSRSATLRSMLTDVSSTENGTSVRTDYPMLAGSGWDPEGCSGTDTINGVAPKKDKTVEYTLTALGKSYPVSTERWLIDTEDLVKEQFGVIIESFTNVEAQAVTYTENNTEFPAVDLSGTVKYQTHRSTRERACVHTTTPETGTATLRMRLVKVDGTWHNVR